MKKKSEQNKELKFPAKAIVSSIISSTLLATMASTCLTYCFQERLVRQERLIEYRTQKLKEYESELKKAENLISELKHAFYQMQPSDFVKNSTGGEPSHSELKKMLN